MKQIPHLTKEYKSLNQHIHIAEVLKRTTDSRDFRDAWQTERGMLEGEFYLDQVQSRCEHSTKIVQLYNTNYHRSIF